VYADAVARASPIRHELLLVDEPEPRQYDAVDILWLASPDAAMAYTKSEEAYRAQLALGGRAFGTERLIARPLVWNVSRGR